MSSSGGGFACNTLHSTAITEDGIGVVVDELVSWLVEDGSGMRLRNGQTHCVAETLTERARCDFNTRSVMRFRVTRAGAVDLLKKTSVLRRSR